MYMYVAQLGKVQGKFYKCIQSFVQLLSALLYTHTLTPSSPALPPSCLAVPLPTSS